MYEGLNEIVTGMSVLEQNFADLGGAKRSLEQRFSDFARLVRARLLLEEAAKWIALVVALALVTYVLDRTLRLSSFTRRGLLIAFLGAIGIQAWRRLLSPLRLKLGPEVLASALERSAGNSIAARVATIIELPSTDPHNISQPMVASAVTRCHEALAGIDFPNHLDPRRRQLTVYSIAATAIFSLGLIIISPSSARLWAARLFAGSNEPWPQRTFLQVAGLGDGLFMMIPRGEAFVLRASAKDGTVVPDNVSLKWRQAGSSSSAISVLLTKFGANDFRYDFPAIQSDAVVELSGGDDVVGPFTIKPVERPRIVDLKLTSQHPTEPKPKTHNFSGDDAGDLSFLPLTQLELTFTANTPVAQAHITSSTTQPSATNLRKINDRQYALAWQHSAATQLQIELTGIEAQLASAPTNVAIGLKLDKPPRTTLGFTGVRQRVTAQATIPLVAEARDDYGVNRIELAIKTEIAESDDISKLKTTATTRPVFGPSTRPDDAKEPDVRQTLSFNVADLQLQPGHLLTFVASATDTCYPQPQTSSSRQVIFRIVRPEELFKEILVRQQSERAKFRKQIDEAKNLRQALAAPAGTDTLSQAGRQHRSIQREASRIQSALSDSLTELRLNVLGNPDAYELMEKGVIVPMKKMDAELMSAQRDALDALRPGDAEALTAVSQRQDQIIVEMEKILLQMSQWDSFIDVLNQLNEIIRLENQVQQGTSQLKKRQTEGIFEP